MVFAQGEDRGAWRRNRIREKIVLSCIPTHGRASSGSFERLRRQGRSIAPPRLKRKPRRSGAKFKSDCPLRGNPSLPLLTLVRGWIERVVRCATKVRDGI